LPHNHPHRLTAEEFEVRIWGFVVGVVTLILAFIVCALLYSVTFVVQPIKSMAPIDIAYTKMLNDIVLLVVGGIGGVMSRKGIQAAASAMASTPAAVVSTSTPSQSYTVSTALPVWTNPPLDESWTPPPPPTTPPTLLESDNERQALAEARAGDR
jgi:hypothetical protein